MNITPRDLEIFRRRKAGEVQLHLADEYGVTPERIRQIEREVGFAEAEPSLVKSMSNHERSAAALLWSRGYKISKPS